MRFEIELSPDALLHLEKLRRFERVSVLSQIESQLRFEPLKPTRRRKLMRSNLIATWELRVSTLRIYYDVDESQGIVLVRAIGIKIGSRVFIGSEEIDLS